MIEHDQVDLLACIAERFRALSDVSRLRLLLVLRQGPQSVTGLTQKLQMAQAGVSKHLGVLRSAGLVDSTRVKNQIIYRIADQRVFDMCAIVCDGVFKQIQSQQLLLASMAAVVSPRKARQGVSK